MGTYSHFYSRQMSATGLTKGASRLDRSYSWGQVNILSSEYAGAPFSDHMMHIVKLHRLLYLPSYITAVFLLFEMKAPHKWWVGATRNTAIMLHGSWFLHTAFALFPHQLHQSLSPWPDSTHSKLPLHWALHLIVILTFQVLIHWLTNRTNAKPSGKAFYNDVEVMSGDDQLPMLNHWQEQEEEIDEKPKDEDEVVFIGGEKESAN